MMYTRFTIAGSHPENFKNRRSGCLKCKTKMVLLLGLCVVGLLSLIFLCSMPQTSGSPGFEYTPHGPISINDNSEFTSANGVNGGGDGTAGNPYIIENWIISALTANGIQIQNTTAYFIIRNCLVENGGGNYFGIYLSNVENGRIENNTSDNTECGIYLTSSSKYDNLTGNTCSNNTYGIYLYPSCNHNNLTNNTCKNNLKYGIYLYSSCNYNNLTNNTCSNNYKGINLYSSCNYNNLTNNTCENNSYGIYFLTSSSNILTGNVISNNRYDIYDAGATNTYSSNQFNNNITSKMLTFTENTRTENVGDNVSFSVSTFNLNGTNLSGCVVTTSPQESSLSYSGSSTVTGSFIPTKLGTYSLNFTVTDENSNTTKRRMLFFVGNTASSTTTYYFRGINPTHGQPAGTDAKSLLLVAPTSTEIWNCSNWIQNSPDEIPNFPFVNLSSINTYTWYNQSRISGAYIGAQRYSTYDASVDENNSVNKVLDYTWINENFTGLNWAMDYPQSWYWLSLKLYGDYPYWTTFPSGHSASEASYATFTYSYTTTPAIKSISNPSIVVLSATEPADDPDNATIVLDGTGSTNIVLDNYRRPFTGYTTTINSDNTATIAANNLTGTTTINSVAMDITPSSGSIDVSIDTWNTSGTYYKKWTENGSSPGITASHTVSDLKANTYYAVKIGGTVFDTYKSNSSGQITFTYNGGYSTKTFEIEESAFEYTPRNPISINGNGQFDNAHGVNGGGNGTAGNPYIIENWAISASANGISIRNTTKYFVVRNCLVENGGSTYNGIYLDNAINGRIENNTCDNNKYGIYLRSSSSYDNLISNTCENNNYGIYLYISSYNNLTNNICENNKYSGIFLISSSNYDNLTNNTCSNNDYGIYLNSSSYDNLISNTCENNNYGIYLNYSSYNNLTSNTCENNYYNFSVWGYGISQFDHDIDNSNLVDGKSIYYFKDNSNLVIGPSLDIGYLGFVRCNNIRVENLMLENNWQGILFVSTENSRIENCIFSNNEHGIYLYSSYYDNLINNTCENNTYGIYLDSSSYNNSTGDTCSNNDYGISLISSSNYDNLTNNTCSNNTYGIYLNSSYNNSTGNTCSNNTYGIYLNSSSYDNLTNNTCSNNTYGIYLNSSSNTLTGNVISNNMYDIYNTGTTNTYYSNQFNNNMISKMLTFVENTRTGDVGDNVSFSVSAFNLDGTDLGGGTTVTLSPSESSLSYSDNGSGTVTGSFTPTRSGTYSLNFTVTDENSNTTKRRMLFFVGNTASTTTKYYFRGISPTHGQPYGTGVDSKTLLLTAPTSTEIWYCGYWVQNSPDEIPNYPLVNLSSINAYTWYKQSKSSGAYIGVERYVTYGETVDNSQSVGAVSNYTWINENFTGLNWAMDYPQNWYWLSLKLSGTNPYWTTFPSLEYENQPSYANFVYSYTTTPIVKSISNPDNILLLSATAPVDDNENATIVLDGTGSTNIVLDNYHRPFIGYTTTINSDNTATIAANGLTGTTTINSVAMNITPSSGSIDVSIDTWNTSGTYYKKWAETGSSPSITASHTIGDLNPATYYTVKVNGTIDNIYQSNPSGQITFTYNGGSSTKTFEIEEYPPATAPIISSPADGTYTNDNTPTFVWITGAYADNHRLLVDNDSDFSSPEENLLLGADNTTYTLSTPLTDENYSWKVIAITATGENESLVWTFIIDTVPPSAPTLHILDNNSIVPTATPTFGWENIIDNTGVTYRLQIDNDNDFSSPIYDKSDILENQHKIENTLTNGTCYWRVRAVDGATNVGDWADNFKLTIQILSPPPSPIPLPYYWISVNPPSGSVEQGSMTTATVSVNAEFGYSALVTLSTQSLFGVEASFSPTSGTASFSSTLTIRVGSGVRTGNYSITIYGIGTDGTHYSCTYSLTVTAAQEYATIIEVGATHIFDFTGRDLPAANVTITVTQTVFDARVSVEVFASKPTEAPTLDLPVYSFFDIQSNIGMAQIENATIEFKVARSWIEQNNIDVTTIRLLNLNGSWQELPTRYLGENANYMYFEAETSHFSLFAVIGKSTTTPPPPALLLPTPLWLLSALPVGIGAGFVLYYRITWRIRPFASLGWLRRVAMRSRWIKPVETSETEIATLIEKLKDATNVGVVTKPIAQSLKELDHAVVWKPKSRKARITKVAKKDIELFKKIRRTTRSRYSGKLSRLQ